MQTYFVLRDTFDEPTPLASIAGAALLPAGFAVLWALVHSRRRVVGAEDEEFIDAARSWGPRLVVVIFFPFIVQTLLLLSLNFVNATKITEDPDVLRRWQDLSAWVFDRQALWSDLLGPAFLVVAGWLASRRRRAAALFVGGVGLVAAWLEVTAPDGWLRAWESSRPRVVMVWVVVLLATAVVWALTGRLSRHRVRGLLLTFGLAVLLGQQGFLEDPLGVLSFLGLVLIALGFVADAAAYGSWANRDSPGLPRVSRVLLYVGYVLFAVALVNWALVTHDLADVQLYTGQGALSGFAALGQPLIFLVFLSVITSRPDRVVSAPAASLPPPPAIVGRPPPPPAGSLGARPPQRG